MTNNCKAAIRYSEPEKVLVRQRALQYAVALLTERRNETAIVSHDCERRPSLIDRLKSRKTPVFLG
jgi:hypothetical protein